MKDILLEAINEVGLKQISFYVKKQGLLSDIISVTSFLDDIINVGVTQRIWHIVHNQGTVNCSCGNHKKFLSYNNGYAIGCNPSCPDISLSRKTSVSKYQQSLTKEEREAIENKRSDTCLKEFQHSAQTVNNRIKFKEYLADPVRLAEGVQKFKESKKKNKDDLQI